jgi:hypothetical protein
MRSRLGGLLALASVLTVFVGATGACNTAGVSYVYMAIDGAGAQHRQEFYTDSVAIYCIAKVSSARQDATIDFVVNQVDSHPWCEPKNNDQTDIHKTFWLNEQTPGIGVETAISTELEPTGVQIVQPCTGYCAQNLPSGNICKGGATVEASCRETYVSLGADSCGLGLTCCQSTIPGDSSSGAPLASVPYPAGDYTCTVSLDGVVAGVTPFSIIYPPGNCPEPPPVDGVPCYNWVPEGSMCPGNSPGQTCTCPATGIWSCE